jgi:hypothetical protein
MKAISAMNKRGGKEVASEMSHSTGLSSVSGAYRDRSNTATGYTMNASRNDNQSSVGSAFYNNKGRGEISVNVDKGDGYCKK